jgi:hypothetical protein
MCDRAVCPLLQANPSWACVLNDPSIPGTNKVTWNGHLRHLPVDDPGRCNTATGERETRPVPSRRSRSAIETLAREYEELLASGTQNAIDEHYKQHGQGCLSPFYELLPYPILPLVGSMHAVCALKNHFKSTKKALKKHSKALFMHISALLRALCAHHSVPTLQTHGLQVANVAREIVLLGKADAKLPTNRVANRESKTKKKKAGDVDSGPQRARGPDDQAAFDLDLAAGADVIVTTRAVSATPPFWSSMTARRTCTHWAGTVTGVRKDQRQPRRDALGLASDHPPLDKLVLTSMVRMSHQLQGGPRASGRPPEGTSRTRGRRAGSAAVAMIKI